MKKLNNVFAKSRPNTYTSSFTVDGEFLSTCYHNKNYVYKIVSIEPNGINILDEADNGTEIKHLISWSQIK